jgi:hypothetical protein
MTRAALIGLGAMAVLVAGTSTASAKVHWNVDVTVGMPAPYVGYYPSYTPFYEPYPVDCFYIQKKKWVKVGGVWKMKHVKKLVCE